MQVILIEDVKSLGKKGTIVKVNDSYGRNYLIPKKLGVEANAVNLNNLKLQNANAEKIETLKLESAKELKALLDGKTVSLKIKTGKDGKAFGAVTAKEVSEAVKLKFKTDVDKKKIAMDPIKMLGTYPVSLKLHKDVAVTLNVKVEEE